MKLNAKLSIATATLLLSGVVQAEHKTFVNCVSRSPSGFSPALVMEGISYNASSQQVYNRLVEFKRGSTEIEPALAESWTVSEDGLTYTFKLRKGVKFHSNKYFKPSREFNADDVIFSFLRQLDKNHPYHNVSKATYPYFNVMKFPQLLKSVEKVNDHTVKITLNKQDATFIASLGMDFISIYSAEYADKLLKAGTPEILDTTPIGTGPFVFSGYQLDQRIRFLAHKDYWNGKADIDRLIFDIVPDATTRYAKLRAGTCDMIDFPNPADLEKMKTDPKINLLSQEGLNIAYIAFNTEKAPFDNIKVRQALNYAVDKNTIIDAVYRGAGVVAKNPLPPTIWGYNNSITGYEYNPEKAKALLKEAGFENGFETNIWVQPVVRASNPNPRRMAELIQGDWEKVGVKTKLVTYEWGDYIKRTKAGELTAGTYGWSGDNGDPDNFLSPLFGSANIGNSNYARFNNPEFDALLEKAVGLSDKAERTKIYEQAQVILNEQAPWINVAHSINFAPTSKRVRDFKQSPFGYSYFYGTKIID
ncbi:dipeptide transport system substrate-binding protein [Nicoletella semolina]|uniref:Dipeptide transport system substrate-binding protein n=1 Tax=Nicoletella semolina TaxID=271160 RepID=A0A4R2N5Z4_9PAST|nr:ABC transporter substrate-binding protein [Nicoletella semolina]MDH2925130.1 peptide transporter [Nicoletella semolina]TCP16228.1 dipeptide transport system substrate-binding protein [Nicoletella semolina]